MPSVMTVIMPSGGTTTMLPVTTTSIHASLTVATVPLTESIPNKARRLVRTRGLNYLSAPFTRHKGIGDQFHALPPTIKADGIPLTITPKKPILLKNPTIVTTSHLLHHRHLLPNIRITILPLRKRSRHVPLQCLGMRAVEVVTTSTKLVQGPQFHNTRRIPL